jgi:hypothetical protein
VNHGHHPHASRHTCKPGHHPHVLAAVRPRDARGLVSRDTASTARPETLLLPRVPGCVLRRPLQEVTCTACPEPSERDRGMRDCNLERPLRESSRRRQSCSCGRAGDALQDCRRRPRCRTGHALTRSQRGEVEQSRRRAGERRAEQTSASGAERRDGDLDAAVYAGDLGYKTRRTRL